MGIYDSLLYTPILNFFFWLYSYLGDFGLVIIVLTLVVRGILYPFYKAQVKSQKAMQDLQPKMMEVKEKYKNDQEGQAKAMMSLYKDNKVNPLSSCLPMVIQLPLFFAVYGVMRDGLSKPEALEKLYSFVSRPEVIDPTFLGVINLAEPNYLIAILAGLAQFWTARMLMSKRPQQKSEGSKDEDMMAIMNKQMMYVLPLIIMGSGFFLPSGLALYWFVSTTFMGAQQYIAFRKKDDSDGIIEAKLAD